MRLEQNWKNCLDLSYRKAPELYENVTEVEDSPYARAIRTTFNELGASAVFCVQKVPTIVILSVVEYDRNLISELHWKLWNQGLASLSASTVR